VTLAFYGLLTFSAFCAGMTVLGAWAAHELRKRFEEYAL
jgi:hypothetical protein